MSRSCHLGRNGFQTVASYRTTLKSIRPRIPLQAAMPHRTWIELSEAAIRSGDADPIVNRIDTNHVAIGSKVAIAAAHARRRTIAIDVNVETTNLAATNAVIAAGRRVPTARGETGPMTGQAIGHKNVEIEVREMDRHRDAAGAVPVQTIHRMHNRRWQIH